MRKKLQNSFEYEAVCQFWDAVQSSRAGRRSASFSSWEEEQRRFGDAFKATRKLFNLTGRRGCHDFAEHNAQTDESMTKLLRRPHSSLSPPSKSRVKEKPEEDEYGQKSPQRNCVYARRSTGKQGDGMF